MTLMGKRSLVIGVLTQTDTCPAGMRQGKWRIARGVNASVLTRNRGRLAPGICQMAVAVPPVPPLPLAGAW